MPSPIERLYREQLSQSAVEKYNTWMDERVNISGVSSRTVVRMRRNLWNRMRSQGKFKDTHECGIRSLSRSLKFCAKVYMLKFYFSSDALSG